MAATVGVVVFPGSNCEHDVVEAIGALGGTARIVWHGSATLGDVDAVILPGGFAHGDYLRPGAIARFSPVMEAVGEFARSGGPVVGICNGFQVLTEARLLPGALQKNSGLRFLCRETTVQVERTDTVLTSGTNAGDRLVLPINHFDGNYLADPETRRRLNEEGMVALRYVDNPNGSVDDIAGICNPEGNVVGLMPHPERACDPLTGGTDGARLIGALLGTQAPRVIPARLSTAESTPTSRQTA
ncbi:MAG TPA: phosphoribosylformylglycinamidine synthase subunit PurQ [Acidimicrobiales bacterium]|nr:phosphoribosylformylglycinamidine synthase subunit PurQ [Acidimicrobiales bacterium]